MLSLKESTPCLLSLQSPTSNRPSNDRRRDSRTLHNDVNFAAHELVTKPELVSVCRGLFMLDRVEPKGNTSINLLSTGFMKLFALAASLIVVVDGATYSSYLQSALQSILSPAASQHQSQPPNFLFVITDDQDLALDSLSYTPLIQKHLRDKGTFFRNHFVTTALCCPSRVSLWTGRLAHNTNVTDVSPPYGVYRNENL